MKPLCRGISYVEAFHMSDTNTVVRNTAMQQQQALRQDPKACREVDGNA